MKGVMMSDNKIKGLELELDRLTAEHEYSGTKACMERIATLEALIARADAMLDVCRSACFYSEPMTKRIYKLQKALQEVNDE